MAHPRRFLTLCVPPPISHILLRVAQSAPAVYSAWLTVVRLRRRASFWKPPTVSKWIHHRLDLDLDLKFDVFWRILTTILKCFFVVTIRVKIVKRNDPLLFFTGSWIEDRIFMINFVDRCKLWKWKLYGRKSRRDKGFFDKRYRRNRLLGGVGY